MEYKYEVTWDSNYPIEDGEGVHRYTQDFLI